MENKMLVLQLIAVLILAHIVVMATHVKEESSIVNKKSPINKREAIELIEIEQGEKPASLLFSAANLTRSHHYWTRKRGRDGSTQDPDYYYQYGYRTTRRSFALRSTPRPKRNTPDSSESALPEVVGQLTEPTRLIHSSTRQQAGIEANLNDPNMIATDRTTEGPIYMGPKPHERNKPRQSHKRFGSKLNNCCAEETNFVGFNETLGSIKSQCLVETRKNRKVNNASQSGDFVEGDGGLYTMFSYDRFNFHRTMVICTINCVAQKTGMIDDDDDVNIEVAKKMAKSNFAQEKWELAASDNLVDKCVDEINTSDRHPVNAFGYQCSSKAAEFVYCMWRELFLTCPDDKQRKSRSCEKLRSVLSTSKVNKFKN